MLKNTLLFTILFTVSLFSVAQNTSIISATQEPVSYATISFGNGNGIFADDAGKFFFTKKLYSDIDSLFISAIGFKKMAIATKNLPSTIVLDSKVASLQEIILRNKPEGKFKVETIKSTTHDDYYQCWLPTIESEIAVFFPNNNKQTKRLKTIEIPIKTEAKAWKKRNRAKTTKKTFSTLFKVNFYENNNGLPGEALTYDQIIFIATEQNEKVYKLDVLKHNLVIPNNGVFVSVQVLGYANAKGKLLPNKKYQEIKTKRGIVKVSTTFRPLLPFTNTIPQNKTFIKRVFLNGGKWVLFNKKNIKNSKLLLEGLNNYGIGLKYEVYKND